MGGSDLHTETAMRAPEELPGCDFEAVESAVRQTARGRWFLREYERRVRAQETAEILIAFERLAKRGIVHDGAAAQTGDARPAPAGPTPRSDLGERLSALREIDALDVEAKVKLFA